MVVLNIIVMLLLALFVVWLLLNLRARHLDQQDGAFRAWARLDVRNRSVSGRSPVLVSLGRPFTETACCPSPTWT